MKTKSQIEVFRGVLNINKGLQTRNMSQGDWSDQLLRDTLFLLTFLLLWLGANPFPDLGSDDILDPVGGGMIANQVATLLLTLALAIHLYLSDSLRVLRLALTPILILTLAWFLLSAVLSANSGLAMRRVVLAGLTIFQACAFVMLPRDPRHFARLLATGSFMVLAVCYAGVLVAPEFSIHQATDLREPELAGGWRGAFLHKNRAGEEMVLFIIFGLFAARRWSAIAGWSLIVLAAIFLIFTQSKSPTALMPFVLVAAHVVGRVHGRLTTATVVLAGPMILTLLTIGSLYIPSIQVLLGTVSSDTSFTGRDVIWQFAVEQSLAKPFIGHGFQAFWGTSELVHNWNYLESWGMRASDAHNAFLNLSTMTGFIGLGLALIWIVAQPLADLVRAKRASEGQGADQPVDPDLSLLLTRVWLFGLYLSSFESVLFGGGSPLWFMMIVTIVIFRMQTTIRLVR